MADLPTEKVANGITAVGSILHLPAVFGYGILEFGGTQGATMVATIAAIVGMYVIGNAVGLLD